ncbi:MAG: hypothetical protein ACKVOL_00500, partial [Novosphingobium sp.]
MKRTGSLWLAAAIAAVVLAAGSASSASGGPDSSKGALPPPANPVGAGEVIRSTDELQSRGGPTIDVERHPGKALFETNCAGCHN